MIGVFQMSGLSGVVRGLNATQDTPQAIEQKGRNCRLSGLSGLGDRSHVCACVYACAHEIHPRQPGQPGQSVVPQRFPLSWVQKQAQTTPDNEIAGSFQPLGKYGWLNRDFAIVRQAEFDATSVASVAPPGPIGAHRAPRSAHQANDEFRPGRGAGVDGPHGLSSHLFQRLGSVGVRCRATLLTQRLVHA